MIENNIVLPGEKLSTSEELLSGDGTFEEDGIIRAARVGKYVVDEIHRKAIVKPVTSVPVMLKRGDTVLAEVRFIRSSMIIADLIHVKGENRGISGDTNGTLRVSEISQSYVKDPASEFSLGDIIRAKITQVNPNIQLETKDRSLGVIKGLCTKCRHTLIKKDNILECENCGNKEQRRTAIDYGNYDLNNL